METKTCSITEDEIKALIMTHAREMAEDDIDDSLERMNYLNRRLKAEKKEVDTKANETNQAAVGAVKTSW